MTGTWRYESSFNKLGNTASEKAGSIHDDSAAQRLGFRKAFVPGSVVAHYAMPAIIERFGEDWLAGGWYDFNFVTPVYIDEGVRTEAREIDGDLALQVITANGRLCAEGHAGASDRLPWTTSGALANVFPDAQIGTAFTDTKVMQPSDAEPMLGASCDGQACWSRHVPPEHLMPIALRMIDFKRLPLEGVKHPGMWAQHAIKVTAPIDWQRPYRFDEILAEKGTSGRTHYLSFEFRVTDEQGTEVAVGRHKCKFIADAA